MSETASWGELTPPDRLMLGPGPSNVHWRVLKAMSTPLVGHLDPYFLGLMDELCAMLRLLFKTRNRLTIPISGTGSAGMETCFVNVLEPGDKAVVCVNGVFGERMADVASRCGAEVVRVEAPWGRVIPEDRVIDTLKAHPDAKVVAIVHAETSTGVRQPLEEIGRHVRGRDTLFLVDTVTSLAGCEVDVDGWGIDLCYSATQKCIGAPPGLAPITVSEKALHVMEHRRGKVQSWYLDLGMIGRYWGEERVYHHTAPVTMIYGLREALRVILEEGLEARFQRHDEAAARLREGLAELGWELFAEEGARLPMLTSVVLPPGVDDARSRRRLLDGYGIEVGAGLGETKGRIWRIGLMGECARRWCAGRLIDALKEMFG